MKKSNGNSRRGFASMSATQRKLVASKGGRTAQASGKAHRFDYAEAQTAGRKGGLAISADREHMAEIGRMGGLH